MHFNTSHFYCLVLQSIKFFMATLYVRIVVTNLALNSMYADYYSSEQLKMYFALHIIAYNSSFLENAEVHSS